MKREWSRIDNGTLPWPGGLGTVQALPGAPQVSWICLYCNGWLPETSANLEVNIDCFGMNKDTDTYIFKRWQHDIAKRENVGDENKSFGV